MFCHKCGAQNPDFAKFCSSCGEALVGAPQKSDQVPSEEPIQQDQPQDQVEQVQENQVEDQPVQSEEPAVQPEEQPAQAEPQPQQQPVQPQSQPQAQQYTTQIPDFNYAPVQPAAPKGCFAQAFSDMMQNISVLAKVALIPAGIALGSIILLLIPIIGPLLGVCGLVCAFIANVCAVGYAIQWGREAAGPFGFDSKSMPFNTPTFSLGFFGDVVANAFSLLGLLPIIMVIILGTLGVVGTASAYGYSSSSNTGAMLFQMGGIMLLAFIATVVLSIFAGMFARVAVMHMAICNKVDETFNIAKVWKGFREKGKLFCAAVLPSWIFGAASAILGTIVWAIAGGSLYGTAYSYSYGYSDAYSSMASGLGSLAVAFGLVLFITLFANALTTLVTNRAVAYWVARYNPEWANKHHLLEA